MDELEQTILDYVIDEYIEDGEEIGVESPLISAGIVDSFSMVSLKTFLERRYKISIPDDKASPEAFDNVKSIAQVVRDILG